MTKYRRAIWLLPVLFLTVAPTGIACVGATVSPVRPPPLCRIAPQVKAIDIPASGARWDQTYEDEGPCERLTPPEDPLECPTAQSIQNKRDIVVVTNGPCGSGRFFTTTLAIKKTTGLCCFSRYLLGTRGLERVYPEAFPTPRWLQDIDQDGEPELIVWESFALQKHPSNGDHAAIGWVYKRHSARRFVFSEELSRRLAKDLMWRLSRARKAKAERARHKLAPFVSGRCHVR